MKNKFTFRDLLAVPFWILGQGFEQLSVLVGGAYTAELILSAPSKQEILKIMNDETK
jgi:hypothetical protein